MNISSFSIGLTNKVKIAFVQVLRAIYTTPLPGFEIFSWNSDLTKTGIKIYRASPLRFTFYPMLSITSGRVNYSIKYHDSEEYSEDYDASSGEYLGTSFNGYTTIPITMTIWSKDEEEREKLTDYTAFFLRNKTIRNSFIEAGIEYKDIIISGETTEMIHAEPIFKNTISVDCVTEYNYYLGVDSEQILRQIEIQNESTF